MRRVLLLLVCLAGPALAQLPDRPIRNLAPFPPGGSTGLLARVMAEAGTPLEALNVVFEHALAIPAPTSRLIGLGATPMGGSTAAMRAHPKAELARWADLGRRAGIRGE